MRHGFDQDIAKALADRRKHKEIGRLVAKGRVVHIAGQQYAGRNAKARRLRTQSRIERAFTENY
jgi:hypothetical protein